jgi:hypothetical protein
MKRWIRYGACWLELHLRHCAVLTVSNYRSTGHIPPAAESRSARTGPLPFVLKFCARVPIKKSGRGPRQPHPLPPVVLLRLLEIADVLLRPDEIARLVVNADDGAALRARSV